MDFSFSTEKEKARSLSGSGLFVELDLSVRSTRASYPPQGQNKDYEYQDERVDGSHEHRR
jgi:hypothetical protein